MSRPEFEDPIARFLGFDPESGLASLKLPDEPAPRLVQVTPQVAADPPAGRPELLSLDAAIALNPRRVLLEALQMVFHQAPEGKRFATVKATCCWAMRELAGMAGFKSTILLEGWIVGKAGDPHA